MTTHKTNFHLQASFSISNQSRDDCQCTCQIFRKAASQTGEFLQLHKYVILLPWLHLTALYLVFSLFVLMEWETNFYYEKHKMTTDFVHCRLRIKWDCCDGGACKQTSEFHWKYCETSG